MNAYRVVLYVLDFYGLGAEGVKTELQETRYANDCISPKVIDVQTRKIGKWSDGHVFNNRYTAKAAVEALFVDEPIVVVK